MGNTFSNGFLPLYRKPLASQIANRKKNDDWGYSNMGNSRDDVIEEQNERLAAELSFKVSRLKSLAFEIENETKDQVGFLGGVTDDFESSHNLLKNTLGRVNRLFTSGRSNRNTMFFVAFFGGLFSFCLLFFISLYQKKLTKMYS